MALPTDLNQRERDKFAEVNNSVAVKVVNADGTSIGSVGGSGGTVYQGTRPWEISTSSLPTLSIAAMPTIYAVTAGTNTGNVTLNPGPNFIGLATVIVANTVNSLGTTTLGSQLPTGINHIGSVTIYGSLTANTGMTTLFPGPNQIGSVTVSNPVVLAAGNNHVGSVSIYGSITANTGMTTLFPGPNFIGLVSAASIHGRVEIMNISNGATVFQGTNPWNSLGTTTLGSMLPTGTNFIGLVTVSGVVSNINLASSNFIGLVSAASIHGRVEVMNAMVTVTLGTVLSSANDSVSVVHTSNVTLNPSPNFIGLATVVPGSNVTLNASNAFIGLVSTASIHGKVELMAGTAFVGLATVTQNHTPLTSLYTSLATVVSASGNATIFVPPASQRWVLKDLTIGVQGSVLVSILSGTVTKIPAMSLATQSGYIQNFGPEGLRAAAADQSFVVNLGSAATVAVMANVRFEA